MVAWGSESKCIWFGDSTESHCVLIFSYKKDLETVLFYADGIAANMEPMSHYAGSSFRLEVFRVWAEETFDKD